jgi:hypothetical protein
LPNIVHGRTQSAHAREDHRAARRDDFLPSDIRDAIACDPRDAIVDAFAIITRRRAVSPRLPHTSHQAMRPLGRAELRSLWSSCATCCMATSADARRLFEK